MQLDKTIDYFIPFAEKLSDKEYRKHKIFVLVAFVTSMYALAYLPLVILESYFTAIPVIVGLAVLSSLLPFLLRSGISFRILANVYLGSFGISEIIILTQGGGVLGTNTDPQILSLLPILALLFINYRTAVIWLIVGISILIIFIQWELRGYDFPYLMNPQYVKMQNGLAVIGHLILFFFVINIFENQKNDALEELTRQSQLLAEEKRKTALYDISQELHDNIGQILTLVKINLYAAKLLQDQNLLLKLDDTLDLVSKAMKDVREISHNLNAENITDFDLIKALKGQTDTITRTGIYVIDLKVSGIRHKFKPQTEFILFRVIQEILNNIIKHAQANTIYVLFNYESKQLSLTIADNGIGISDEKTLLDGQGIRTMRSRIEVIGGSFNIASQRSEGTVVSITVPIAS